MYVAITGHRPQHLPCGFHDNHPVRQYIEWAIGEHLKQCEKRSCEKGSGTPPTLITGMALGVDQWAAEVCIRLGYPFVAFIPCTGQESRWSPPQQRRYTHLLNQAADVHYVHAGPYYDGCMTKRNEAMVMQLAPCDLLWPNPNDHVLAIWTGKQTGGTAHCVRYARSKNRHVVVIDPTKVPASILAKTAIKELRNLITPALLEAFEVAGVALGQAMEPCDSDLDPKLREKIMSVAADVQLGQDLLNRIKTPR